MWMTVMRGQKDRVLPLELLELNHFRVESHYQQLHFIGYTIFIKLYYKVINMQIPFFASGLD